MVDEAVRRVDIDTYPSESDCRVPREESSETKKHGESKDKQAA